MSIFDLHAKVIADYQEYVRSYINISDERIRRFVDQWLIEEQKPWPEFLLQSSPDYERSAPVDEGLREGIFNRILLPKGSSFDEASSGHASCGGTNGERPARIGLS